MMIDMRFHGSFHGDSALTCGFVKSTVAGVHFRSIDPGWVDSAADPGFLVAGCISALPLSFTKSSSMDVVVMRSAFKCLRLSFAHIQQKPMEQIETIHFHGQGTFLFVPNTCQLS